MRKTHAFLKMYFRFRLEASVNPQMLDENMTYAGTGGIELQQPHCRKSHENGQCTSYRRPI
jgi:hypothetical protein